MLFYEWCENYLAKYGDIHELAAVLEITPKHLIAIASGKAIPTILIALRLECLTAHHVQATEWYKPRELPYSRVICQGCSGKGRNGLRLCSPCRGTGISLRSADAMTETASEDYSLDIPSYNGSRGG